MIDDCLPSYRMSNCKKPLEGSRTFAVGVAIEGTPARLGVCSRGEDSLFTWPSETCTTFNAKSRSVLVPRTERREFRSSAAISY
jgi:hypothetical protein